MNYPACIKHNTVLPVARQALLLVCVFGGDNYGEVLLVIKKDTIYTVFISVEVYYGQKKMIITLRRYLLMVEMRWDLCRQIRL